MARVKSDEERRVEEAPCPVARSMVTVSATYRRMVDGGRCLVEFGCDRQGRCLIPDWDPCPLYIVYRD